VAKEIHVIEDHVFGKIVESIQAGIPQNPRKLVEHLGGEKQLMIAVDVGQEKFTREAM
jgi:hypothetical protein